MFVFLGINNKLEATMRAFTALFLQVLCVFFFICDAFSGPAENTGKYSNLHPMNQMNQNEWTSILTSIESRIKNLDNLYTSQLTPTLETRLEHFQNRISGMEVKLLRIEALLTTKLDRMSDNISSRHFRDDMVQTDLFRKIENAYDGLTHRLAYMDRKSDNDFLKIQSKVETISKKLENMDDAFTTKYDSLESDLSDYVAGVDDLKSFFRNTDEKLAISLEKHYNFTREKQEEMQDFSKKNIMPELSKTMTLMHENVSKTLENLRWKMHLEHNKTETSIQNLSSELGVILNEYASKVSDLGEQVSKSDHKIATHLSTIETVTNSTRIETQNGLRALMVQVGKISNKEQNRYEVVDQRFLADMGETLNSNFEKIINTQNTFLESCHRVQMDESQLETQISDILNKLIDNFAKTSREQHHVLKKIDGLLTKHDGFSKREMHQIKENIINIFEMNKKDFKELDVRLRKTGDDLEALFALVQNNIGHTTVKRGLYLGPYHPQPQMESSNNDDDENWEIIQSFARLESKQTDINEQLNIITENIENIIRSNTTKNILESVIRTNELIGENTKTLGIILNSVTNPKNVSESEGRSSRNNSTTDIDELIREVFFNGNSTNTSETQTKINDNDPDCLDFDIDVRFEVDNSTGKSSEKCRKAKIEPTEKYTDGILFPTDDENPQKNSLEVPIDVRFESSKSNDKLNTNRTEPIANLNGTLENEKQDEINTEIDNSTKYSDQNAFN